MSKIFYMPQAPKDVARRHVEEQDHQLNAALDKLLIEQATPAIELGQPVEFKQTVRNVNRSVGAMLSGALVRQHAKGLPDQSIVIHMEGTGGQSFGAFLATGITICLTGDANDYTGKGLSGGRIVIKPNALFRGDAAHNIIAGNTVLYGATAGEAFLRGVAGERFAVRLCGATAVVEGIGDHGCEYMTAGTVVVLGAVGRNFAAGMSGGVAYVFDEDQTFKRRCNTQMVRLEPVLTADEQAARSSANQWHMGLSDEVLLLKLLKDHYHWTGSLRAQDLLAHWSELRGRFVKVLPIDYARVLEKPNTLAKDRLRSEGLVVQAPLRVEPSTAMR